MPERARNVGKHQIRKEEIPNVDPNYDEEEIPIMIGGFGN